MVAAAVLHGRAAPDQGVIQGGGVRSKQPPGCREEGNSHQFGRGLDVGNADVLQRHHGQPSPKPGSVHSQELVPGTTGNLGVAAPNSFLHGAGQQVRIGVVKWSGRGKIGGVVGWVVVVTQMLEQQRRCLVHALGLRLGLLRADGPATMNLPPGFLDRRKIGRHRLRDGEHSLAVVVTDPAKAKSDQLQRAVIGNRPAERLLHRVGAQEHALSVFAVSSAVFSLLGSCLAGSTQRRPEKRLPSSRSLCRPRCNEIAAQ
jgi:hypothetical protein